MDITEFNNTGTIRIDSDKIMREERNIKKFRFFDGLFRSSLGTVSILFVIFILAIFITLLIQSIPSIRIFGLSYFTNSTWNPVGNEFGSLPFLAGTIIT